MTKIDTDILLKVDGFGVESPSYDLTSTVPDQDTPGGTITLPHAYFIGIREPAILDKEEEERQV